MFLGPIFLTEAVLQGRKRRTYWTRLAIGLLLLVVIGNRYLEWTDRDRNSSLSLSPSTRATARFARSTVDWLLLIQAACVFALVPPLVAGIVAEERQARTLPDLLASRLSSFEIVVGKLAARLLTVFTWLGIGVPILALLGLFGGVDPETVLMTEMATASTAIALGSFTALVSTVSRRPRDVLLFVYAVGLTWLVGSGIGISLPMAVRGFAGLASPELSWAWRSSPFWALTPFSMAMTVFNDSPMIVPPVRVFEMMEAQVVASASMLAIAVWRLRPASRSLESGPRQRRIIRPRRRPPVGDDAMLWKERYATGVERLGKFILVPTAFLVLAIWYFGITGYYGPFAYQNLASSFDAARRELLDLGYGIGPLATHVWARNDFNGYLGTISGLFVVPWLIAVAAVSASGVTSERERATWTALLASPLTAVEIIRAKLLAAAWGLKPFLAFVAGPWFLGLAMGATHPIGLLAAIVGLLVMTWYASAFGTFVSIRSRTTTSAMSRAVAGLLAIDLFAVILLGPLITSGRASWLLFQPTAISQLPISRYAFARLSTESPSALFRLSHDEFVQEAISGRFGYVPIAILATNVLFYAILASILTVASIRSLNAEADRPRKVKNRGPTRR